MPGLAYQLGSFSRRPRIPFNTFYAIMLDINGPCGFEIVTIVTLPCSPLRTEQHNKDFVHA